jgi:hypothetical protein
MVVMGDGIAHDMLTFLVTLIRGGRGYWRHHVTDGGSKDVPLAQELNEITPAITIANLGTSDSGTGPSIKFGCNGVADTLLLAGASATFRWKNPRVLRLTINDLGNAGVGVLVYG